MKSVKKSENSIELEVPLTLLRDGETGIISSIGDYEARRMDRGFKKRLMDMGMTPGTKVTVLKSAPLDGPIEVLVRGVRLALGRGVAERVFVRKERQNG
ncbi:MAG: FeoA family protein [Nitrososphaerota archaeon]|nr:ferrous iron transport protein A [Candidatus Bathyarchaeota archaeon]MDW8048549.1 FeoA family protein [Nitrososphaerota archaeon]